MKPTGVTETREEDYCTITRCKCGYALEFVGQDEKRADMEIWRCINCRTAVGVVILEEGPRG